MEKTYAILSNVNRIIINPIILIILGAAFIYFLYGVAEFLWKSQSDPTAVKKGTSHMLWGLVGMFLMISVFGIFKFLLNTVPTTDNTKANVDRVIKINN